MPYQYTPTCSCGQLLLDSAKTAEPQAGETLACPACKKQYKYLGAKLIEPVVDNIDTPIEVVGSEEILTDAVPVVSVTADSNSTVVVEGSEEVFIHSVPDTSETARFKSPVSAKRRTTQVMPRGNRTTDRSAADKDPDASARSRRSADDTPGGIMPMIGFMIVFNVLAFVALTLLFPTQPDRTRLAFWGAVIPHSKIPWPELVTLVLGQLFGFGGWAIYVYRLHKRQREALKEAATATAAAAERNTVVKQCDK